MTIQPLVFTALAATSVSITSPLPDADCQGGEVTVTGTATATAPQGQLNQYHVQIDWGDGNTNDETEVSSFSISQNPDHGTQTRSFTGAHTYGANSSYTIKARIYHETVPGQDNQADDVASVVVCVVVTNNPPTANDDAYSTNEDVTLAVLAADGVLDNDTDVDSDPLTASLVTTTSNGTLSLNADGSFTYTPNAGFEGSDSFTYTANDGEDDSNAATVTITVNHVNHAPVANEDSYTTDEDIPLTVPASGVLGNDSDPDLDAITAVVGTGPSNGTLVLDPDGGFTYTPSANFNGTDSFTYAAYDGGLNSNVVTVTINASAVNDAPIANDDSYSTDEDVVLIVSAPGILGNDTDVEGDLLSAILANGPSSGTLNLNSDGSFDYTPNADFNGTDSFTYTANDGDEDSNIATVTLTVSNTNDTPVANADEYSINEDMALIVDAPGVLNNDSDTDGDSLTVTLVDDVANGILTFNGDGGFIYVPNQNFNGTDSFTYTASDGSVDSGEAVVTLTVDPANDAPIAVGDSYNTNEDTGLEVLASGVLLNDSDIDGDSLEAILVDDVTHGNLTLNDDGSFTYMPEVDFNGVDQFTYKANDGDENSNTVTVEINIGSVPDSQCDDGEDNDGDENVDFGEDTGCTGPHDDWEEEDPPVSTFDSSRNHEVITTELASLSLNGSSVDDESGFGSAVMHVYQVANEVTMLGEGFLGQPNDEEVSPFEAMTCSPLPQGAIETELVQLNLVSVNPLTSNWNHDWTPTKGIYCAIVNATDAASNVEHTGITGPFAYNPTPPPTSTPTPTPTPTLTPTPTPTPSQTPTDNGGGGGGGPQGEFINGPGASTPSVAGASIVAPPQVAGAMTVLPETGASAGDRMLLSLFAALFATGALMLLAGYEMLPRKLLSKIR